MYAFAPEDPALTFQSEKDGVLTLGSYTAKPLWGLRFSVGQGNAREVFVMEEKLPDGGYRIRPDSAAGIGRANRWSAQAPA